MPRQRPSNFLIILEIGFFVAFDKTNKIDIKRTSTYKQEHRKIKILFNFPCRSYRSLICQ